jgi:WD40 repeat protein
MISLLSSALLVPLLFACEAPQSAPTPTQRTVDEPSMIDALPERAVQRFGTRRLLHPGLIYAAVFGGGGEWFATGAEDGWVRVFDGKTGDLLRAMDARGNGGVVHLAISRDGTRIAAGTRGSILKIFRVATGESVGELEEAGMASAWLDEGRFASIDGTKRVFLVDAESGAQLAEFDTSPHGMEDIVLSPCGRWIAARGRNREKLLARAGARGDTSAVFVFDAGSFEHVGTIGFADASTTDMVFSPDGERLYIADDLGRVDVYAPSEREEVDLLAGDGLPILSMALDPVGRQLLLARSGGAVERVRLEPFERIDSWLSRAAEYGRLVCRPSDGAVLATSGQHLELRSASDGSPIVAPRRHLSVVKALDFSADGSRLLS